MEARQKITYYDCASGRVSFEERTPFVADESTLARQVESNVVGVYPDYLYQTMEGFGCAMTESACWLLSKMEPPGLSASPSTAAITRLASIRRWKIRLRTRSLPHFPSKGTGSTSFRW